LLWLDPLTTAFWPEFCYLKFVNILYQTMVYAVSICTNLDSL